jgi:DNA-binding beta-propeller fold protein YncE
LSLLLIVCALNAHSQYHSPNLISTVSLPDVLGRIDHMAYNRQKQFLYIAALGNNSLEVVDLKNEKAVHSVKRLKEPQGVVYIPDNNSIFVTNGNTGECDFFDAESYLKLKSIKLSGDADNVRYDSIDKRIYVGYGDGRMAIIDALSTELLKEIKLSEHPESFQIDKTARRVYVNIPFQSEIEIIDMEKSIVTDRWKLNHVSANFPMSLNNKSHRLFIGCRDPAKLLVINTETGETVASLDIDKDIDDLYYDSSTQQLYLSCGSGFLDVFSQNTPDSYVLRAKVPTRRGARTSLFIPELNKLVVAVPASLSAHALLLIYEIK